MWRLSIAEVQTSGPFSDFSGYERTIMLLEGDGMELSFDARPPQVLDVPHRPFTFDGGWKTACRLLGGPVRDLNLMVRRGAATGALEVAALPARMRPGDWSLVLVLRGSGRLGEQALGAGELLQAESLSEPLEIAGEGEIARVVVQSAGEPRPLSQNP